MMDARCKVKSAHSSGKILFSRVKYMIKLRYERWRKLILEILKKSVVDSIKHQIIIKED